MSSSRQIWLRLWGYLREDRKTLFWALVCAVGVAQTSIAVTGLMGVLLNLLKGGGSGVSRGLLATITRFVLGPPDPTGSILGGLTRLSLSLVGIYLVQWIFVWGSTVAFAEVGMNLGVKLRKDIYSHLQFLSLSYFNRARTGAMMSTLNNDVPLLQGTVGNLKDIAPAPFRLISGLVVIFLLSWKLSLIGLVVAPLMGWLINSIGRKIRAITLRTQDKLADVNALMAEALGGIRIIQSFGAERHEIARFDRENLASKALSMSGVRQTAWLKPTIDVIGAVGIAAAIWAGGYLIARGEMTLAGLAVFVLSLDQIARGINGIGGARITYEQVIAGGGRIFENVLNVESEVRDAPNAVTLETVTGRIEFAHVAFAYNEHTPVLRDVSFVMEPGEVVAVVGPSGAGKSTIADLIPRFYDPQEGKITLGGHDLREVTLASLRAQIGIVPQETVLFGGTIRDNIAYGRPDATNADIEAAACAANAHDFVSDPRVLPDGYQTKVGERGKQLSGGQRQRIAIARALLKDPRILILDEATSSLDAASEILVQEALEQLMHGRTTLVIAHRLSTIVNADKILVLKDGAVAEAGTHAQLVKIPGGQYARLYETQFRADGP